MAELKYGEPCSLDQQRGNILYILTTKKSFFDYYAIIVKVRVIYIKKSKYTQSKTE